MNSLLEVAISIGCSGVPSLKGVQPTDPQKRHIMLDWIIRLTGLRIAISWGNTPYSDAPVAQEMEDVSKVRAAWLELPGVAAPATNFFHS